VLRLPAIVVAALLCVAVLLLALPASATEFFAADFESGDLSQWGYVQALPDRAAVVDDPVAQGAYAGRFEVEEGDEEPDTGSQRAEVRSGLEYEEGDVRYFRVLSRVESWDYDHWGIVWQIHDQSVDSPPLSLQLRDEGSGPTLWLGHGDGESEYWEAPLPGEDEWFEVVVRAEIGDEGSVRVWLDGEEQTMLNGDDSVDGIDTLGDGPGYDKLGIYRSSEASDTAVVYHDDYRVTDELFSEPPE
jgi:hypothetical protein